MKIKWFGDWTSTLFKKLPAQELSPRQQIFDLIFGVVGPILCLVFDPVVFKSSPALGMRPMFSHFALSAYLAIGLGTLTLAFWLLRPPDSDFLIAFSAGVMTIGWVFSLLLGLVMLPFSIMGLFFLLVGIFGFTPFITAFVYKRNAANALRLAKAQVNRNVRTAAITWAIVFSLVIPGITFWGTNRYVSTNIDLIIDGDPNQAYQAAKKLESAFWCPQTCFEDLIFAYSREEDPSRQELLKNIYFQITGEDINQPSLWLID